MGTALHGACSRPGACARAGAALTLWDKVEDVGLQARLALQAARGDPRAAETAVELHLERLDNAPGNTTFRETQEALSTLVGRYGDDVARLVGRFGKDGAALLAAHQDEAVDILRRGERAVGHWTDYLPPGYYHDVVEAFEDNAVAVRLTEDLVAYRYWGGASTETGNWLTTSPDLSPEEARALLALPNQNPAERVTEFVIPRDTIEARISKVLW